MDGVVVHSTTEEQERIRALTPLGRKCQLKELVGAYIFLNSPGASYITGHVLQVVSGFTAL